MEFVPRRALLIADRDWMSAFLIGHENAPLHRKLLCRLASGS